jgi:hypothetical protein
MTRARGCTALILAALVALAATRASAEPRISVVFVAPERFTDVKDGAMRSAPGEASILDELGRFVRETGERHVPAGVRLEVRVTDVDLAGDFEPWRGPQFERVRFLREIYPPRIDVEFRLVDAAGRVVKEGRRSLTDPLYLTRAARVADDRLRYEKDLLSDWLRTEFAA